MVEKKKGMKGPLPLGRIESWAEETKSTIAFVANNFKLGRSTSPDKDTSSGR